MSNEHDPLKMIEKIRGSELSRNTAIRTIMNDAVLKQKIKSYILKNSGDASDAETIFHDAIVTFVKTVFTKKEFQLSVHWHGFMLGTARNLWMNALRKKKKHVTVSIEHASHNESGENNMNLLLKGERGRILQLVLNEMKKRCKDVLMLWASGYKMVEIATQLGYKSEGVARKKKSECMKELYTYLGNNPHIKERIRPV